MPHGASPEALGELWPVFLSYVLSFANVGIYWNNHHRLLHTVKQVNGAILWANWHLLFWLSLFPFTIGWMGENRFAAWPVAAVALAFINPWLSCALHVSVALPWFIPDKRIECMCCRPEPRTHRQLRQIQ